MILIQTLLTPDPDSRSCSTGLDIGGITSACTVAASIISYSLLAGTAGGLIPVPAAIPGDAAGLHGAGGSIRAGGTLVPSAFLLAWAWWPMTAPRLWHPRPQMPQGTRLPRSTCAAQAARFCWHAPPLCLRRTEPMSNLAARRSQRPPILQNTTEMVLVHLPRFLLMCALCHVIDMTDSFCSSDPTSSRTGVCSIAHSRVQHELLWA